MAEETTLSRYRVWFTAPDGRELSSLWIVATDDADATDQGERYAAHHRIDPDAKMTLIRVKSGAAEPKRWHVHADDDFIWAETADQARAQFIQALAEDGSLIYVSDAEAFERSSLTDG